jgi:hypothetical protein
MHDNATCPNCVSWQAQFYRSEEKRIRDAVTYQVKLSSPKHNVRPGVEEDLIARVLGMGEWREDKKGRLVLHKAGLEVLSNTGHEITPEVAIRDLQPTAPHFFVDGEDTAKDSNGPNPWIKGPHWNMTRQGELFLQNPENAKRLAAAAGITLTD